MWVAIIRAVALLLGISIVSFSGISEKLPDVISEPIKEVRNTFESITPIFLIGAAIWAYNEFF